MDENQMASNPKKSYKNIDIDSKEICEECKSYDLVSKGENLICKNCGLVQTPSIKHSDTKDIKEPNKDNSNQKRIIELFNDENFSYEDVVWDYDEDLDLDPLTNDLIPDIRRVMEYEQRLKHPEIEKRLNREIKKSYIKKSIKITYVKNNKLKIIVKCPVCSTKNVFHQNGISKNDLKISFFRKCKKCSLEIYFKKNRKKFKIFFITDESSL